MPGWPALVLALVGLTPAGLATFIGAGLWIAATSIILSLRARDDHANRYLEDCSSRFGLRGSYICMTSNDDRFWQAVADGDSRFDGQFFCGVTSTGIYCRPSCPARTPKRENVRFFAEPLEAQRAELRACKRCDPDAATSSLPTFFTTVDSPIGELLLHGDGETLFGLHMQGGKTRLRPKSDWRQTEQPFAAVKAQLAQYFTRERTAFDLPLSPSGTAFQRQVWSALRTIPYGQTRSYKEIATAVGDPSAARAVGAANGQNPIAVIVPCHRVIGADGSLTGFGGGLDRKRTLLDLEADTLFPLA